MWPLAAKGLFGTKRDRKGGGGGEFSIFKRNFRFCTFLVSSKLIFEVNIFNGRTPAHMLFKEWNLLALGLVFVAF